MHPEHRTDESRTDPNPSNGSGEGLSVGRAPFALPGALLPSPAPLRTRPERTAGHGTSGQYDHAHPRLQTRTGIYYCLRHLGWIPAGRPSGSGVAAGGGAAPRPWSRHPTGQAERGHANAGAEAAVSGATRSVSLPPRGTAKRCSSSSGPGSPGTRPGARPFARPALPAPGPGRLPPPRRQSSPPHSRPSPELPFSPSRRCEALTPPTAQRSRPQAPGRRQASRPTTREPRRPLQHCLRPRTARPQ